MRDLGNLKSMMFSDTFFFAHVIFETFQSIKDSMQRIHVQYFLSDTRHF